MNLINGWQLESLLRKHDGTYVYKVTRDTLPGEWVLKLSFHRKNIEQEILAIESFQKNNTPSVIALPPQSIPFSGMFQGNFYYVMKFYPESIPKELYLPDIYKILQTCIGFARDLHHDIGMTYLDWRLDNLYKDGDSYIVADYEFCRHASDEDILTFEEGYEEDPDYYYYFLERGAVPDKPLRRFRADLEGIAYIGMSMFWETKPYFSKQFEKARSKSWREMSTKELLFYRQEYIDQCVTDPCLRAFLEAIQECSWDNEDPMPCEWYDSLIEIFST